MEENNKKSEDTAKLLLDQHSFELERLERELNESKLPHNKILVFIVVSAIIILLLAILAKMLGQGR